jgi:hypothetical protein
VAERAPRQVRGSAPGGHGSTVEEWAAKRELYLDNLKVILIAAIIAGHGVASYASAEFWPYAEMREVSLSPVTEIVLLAVVVPFSLLMIPMLFLVAGLLTPPSLERKGPARFVRDRLVRLGVPFAVFVLLLWPLLMYPVHPPGEAQGSYWNQFFGAGHASIDPGPLWFVGVLLLLSLVYAGWVRWRRPRHPSGSGRVDVTAVHLLATAAAVAVSTFLIRLVLPYESNNPGLSLNLYEWPSCIAMFSIGVISARSGWLTRVPDRLRRQSRTAALAAVVAFGAFMGTGAALGAFDEEVWRGGWDWSAVVFPALEAMVTVFGPVWLLAEAQRHLDRRLGWVKPAFSRSAYGAFILQGLVLLGLAVALRPVPLPAEVKALIVATGGVAGSFALAWLLISRLRGVARVL